MSDDTKTNRIDGLDPGKLFRTALGESATDPAAAERAAKEERRVRVEIEQRLSDLEIIELLGRGGMGYVYRARQKRLDREVAVKVVAAAAERQDDFAKRFAREARALARLSHPNLVTIHDYGQDGSFGWLVMEYVDGSNLRDLIRAGKLEPAEALALIPKICDALQYAHDKGVVHRDVKPENILVDREGGVKIADFGLAKVVGIPAALVSLTGSREVLGTFRYMAPEQLDRPLEVDHRADIYSLGVVFYEMLTGEIPMGRFDPPSAHSAATPQLDDVVLRALAREPDRRYQRAAEVKDDLESLGQQEQVDRGDQAKPAGQAQRSDQVKPNDSATQDQTKPADPPPVIREPPRLSTRAVVSALLALVGLLPFIMAAMLFADSDADTSEGLMFFGFLLFVGGLGTMAVGTVLGFRALRHIRREWPRKYGVGAAVFGAWAAIFVFLNGVLLGSLGLSEGGSGFVFLLLLVGEAFFLVRYRRRFLERCARSGGM